MIQNKITIEQALTNLKAVCEAFVGNKKQHIVLDQSLELITEKLFPKNKENEQNAT